MNTYQFEVGCKEGNRCSNSVFSSILVTGTDEFLGNLDEFQVQEAVVHGEVTLTVDEIRSQSQTIQDYYADDIADAEDGTVVVRVEIESRCCDEHGSDQEHGDQKDDDFPDAP